MGGTRSVDVVMTRTHPLGERGYALLTVVVIVAALLVTATATIQLARTELHSTPPTPAFRGPSQSSRRSRRLPLLRRPTRQLRSRNPSGAEPTRLRSCRTLCSRPTLAGNKSPPSGRTRRRSPRSSRMRSLRRRCRVTRQLPPRPPSAPPPRRRRHRQRRRSVGMGMAMVTETVTGMAMGMAMVTGMVDLRQPQRRRSSRRRLSRREHRPRHPRHR